jgi:hypothetical protein
MTLPSLLFGILISTLYGALYHLWRGGSVRKLLLFVVLAWIGFWGGHFLGEYLGWIFAPIGPLNLGMATLGAALVLGLGDWLSQVEIVGQ